MAKRGMVRLVLGVVLVAVLGAAVAVPAHAETKKVRVTANRVVYQGPKGDTVVEGDVRIEYGESIITAPRAVVNMETKKAKITGGVVLVKGDVRLSTDTLETDFQKEVASATGNVRLEKREVQQEKDESGKPKVQVITMTCLALEISTETEDFTAKGSVAIMKDRQTATADRAEYSSSRKSMVLTGSVFVQGAEKETIRCDRATFYTDREAVEAEGKPLEITFEVRD